MFTPPKREPDLILDNNYIYYSQKVCFWWEEMVQSNESYGMNQWYKVIITKTGNWYWEYTTGLSTEGCSYDDWNFFLVNKHKILNSYSNFLLEKELFRKELK